MKTEPTPTLAAVDQPRLVLRLRSAVAHMAPHQRDSKNGLLLVECLEAINAMEIRHAATMLHTQTIVDEANAMREWIMKAAPMLSIASCIVIDEAVERLGEIAGCRALLELCPVDFISSENADVMAAADDKTPPKETTL